MRITKHIIGKNAVAAALISVLCLLPSAFALAPQAEQGKVSSVIDGDTFKVKLGVKTETVRIIGIDTPETKDPRKPVQCYGKEASKKLTTLLRGKTVVLEKNPAEDRDKYQRLLRYVSLNGKDIGASMIADGYAFSYKIFPHPRLESYNALEQKAKSAKKGLWGNVCDYAGGSASSASSAPAASSCTIKGNISNSGEKIYHLIGCGSYTKTVIDESAGERWFCSEKEAKAAGWRKAGNCR